MSGSALLTAGLTVGVAHERSNAMRTAVLTAAGDALTQTESPCRVVLDTLTGFSTSELTPITRGVWADSDGVLIDDVGGSGFQQHWRLFPDPRADGGSCVRVSTRWSPRPAVAAAARVLPQRHRALCAQILVHYPALWTAVALEGMSPLHVSLLEVEGVAVLLVGPGGVGKSSLVVDALAHGARAVCDNLAVSDGRTVHGLVEPLRLPRGVDVSLTRDAGLSSRGAGAAHGRHEHRWTKRLTELRPELVVAVRRDDHGPSRLRPVSNDQAAASLVGGTYAAGELQRFWPLVAQLGLGGLGPVDVPVRETATRITQGLPCYELTLGRPVAGESTSSGRLAGLLDHALDSVRRHLYPHPIHLGSTP